MKDKFGDLRCLEGVFRFSWNASSELGRWCSDRAWIHALADDVLPKLEGNITRMLESELASNVPEQAYKEISRVKEASEMVKNYTFNNPTSLGDLSPKVRVLRDELGRYFERPTGTKCIVFTQKRSTAKTLYELFTHLNMPHLHPGVLVGLRSGDVAGMNITFRQQFLTLVKFRKGEVNCLVSDSDY